MSITITITIDGEGSTTISSPSTSTASVQVPSTMSSETTDAGAAPNEMDLSSSGFSGPAISPNASAAVGKALTAGVAPSESDLLRITGLQDSSTIHTSSVTEADAIEAGAGPSFPPIAEA